MRVSGSTIAVTGATGMLGSHIARALADAGAKVRAVVRNPAKGRFLEPLGVEFATSDLLDRASLEAAFRGADAVVSCAALWVLGLAPWEEFYRANVTGTENVYEAMGGAGVGRAVHISTFGVYRLRPFRVVDESASVLDGERREGGAYRATKALSEGRARELSARHGIGLTLLRPAGLFGARDAQLLPKLAPLVRLPVSPVPTVTWPMGYAGDVAKAVVGALENDASVGEVYNVTGENLPFSDFVRALKATHPKARGVTLPLPLPVRFPASSEKAKRELGFSNRPFEESLRETFENERLDRI